MRIWRRRFENPTRRDWLLGALLIAIAAVVAISVFIGFRWGAASLSAVLVALAAIRSVPSALGEAFKVRSRVVDIGTLLVLAVGIFTLAATVPGGG